MRLPIKIMTYSVFNVFSVFGSFQETRITSHFSALNSTNQSFPQSSSLFRSSYKVRDLLKS